MNKSLEMHVCQKVNSKILRHSGFMDQSVLLYSAVLHCDIRWFCFRYCATL